MAKANSPINPSSLLDDFKQALIRENVGIIEFAEGAKYIGKTLYPRQRVLLKLIFLEELDGYEEDVLTEWINSYDNAGDVRICPQIRERVQWCRDQGYPHFRLVQLVGGRRSSKGHISGICIARKVFELVQLDDPGAYYGVDPDKDIYIPIIAAKEDQAKMHQYGDAQAAIRSCVALQKYIRRIREEGLSVYTPSDIRKEAELRARGVDIMRDMAKIRVAPFASSADTVRGSASIAAVFDEMAFMLQGESRRSGDEVWSATLPSLEQFGKDALVLANSSPYTEIGKFFELYNQGYELEEGKPRYANQLTFQFPSWELYKDWEKDRRFKNAIIVYESVKGEESKNPEKFKVEYRAQFEKTLDAYLRPEKVDKMFEGFWDGQPLETRYSGIAMFDYKGHGDPSQTTANFGLAIGHVEYRLEEVMEEGPQQGQIVNVPHVVFDLIDAFYPGDYENHTIDWHTVMDTILTLIQNFRPYEFTFDQFDSLAPMQMLQSELSRRRISGCRLGIERATPQHNRRRADNFKAALYMGRVHAPNPIGQINQRSLDLAREELKFLQEKNGKVVKQDIGPIQTKDIADCIMEVVDSLIGNALSGTSELLGQNMQAGGQHGYRIGSRNPFLDFERGLRRSQLGRATGSMPQRGRFKKRNF